MNRHELTDLLDGLEGEARSARSALIEELLTRGCTPEEIRVAHEEERLDLMPLELALREDGSRTLEETAAAHGVEPNDLEVTRRALGLPVERGQPVYGQALASHAERLRTAVDAGMPVTALVSINRVIGRSMMSVAAGARDALLALLSESGVPDHERPLRAAQAAEALAPELERVLAYAFLEHVREMVRQEAGSSLLAAGAGADVREVGIAFADLVGFTSLGETLGPAEVGRVAERLESLAGEAVRPRVNLVKTIGDEIMLASEDVPALVASVLELVAAADADDVLPSLRAGAAAGPAVGRAGDWYGRTVNLASRLTALADPGTLLADAALRAGAPGAAEWTEDGTRMVKGMREPVTAYRARKVGS
jgi:adenylate cyclase